MHLIKSKNSIYSYRINWTKKKRENNYLKLKIKKHKQNLKNTKIILEKKVKYKLISTNI